ncbi:MAG TPA: hypothetical protein VGI78_24605, partial [Acetobacteraceae bacterium]
TVCISQPRLETCVDSQIERKIGFRSGANVAGGTEALAALTPGLILPGHNPLTLQCGSLPTQGFCNAARRAIAGIRLLERFSG